MFLRMITFLTLCSSSGILGISDDETLLALIRKANTRWMDAFDRGDANGIADCYTEDARLMPPGTDVIIGRQGISEAFHGIMESGVKRAVLSVDEVGMIHTDRLAYERSHFTFYNQAGSVVEHGKYVVIWKNMTGHFYLYTDIINSNSKSVASHWLN